MVPIYDYDEGQRSGEESIEEGEHARSVRGEPLFEEASPDTDVVDVVEAAQKTARTAGTTTDDADSRGDGHAEPVSINDLEDS